MNTRALQRPDLSRSVPRTINMSAIGDALLGFERSSSFVDTGVEGAHPLREELRPLDPPIRAVYVYNSNPVAVAPDSARVVAGFAREDLFTVVHEIFQTDTADYADILLPATTQLEQFDVHRAYGHLYVVLNQPAIAPLGEAKPNTEVFRLLARAMGFADPCFDDTDEELIEQAVNSADPRMAGITYQALQDRGWMRLAVPERFAPFAEGGFPTPSGRCEFFSQTLAEQGIDPLPAYVPPRESAENDPALAARYPLTFLSPPAHNFLNSSFANLPSFLKAEKEPRLDLHPEDAAARGIVDGDWVRAFNDRGSLRLRARVTTKARPGVVIALSIWWRKLTPDGQNANQLTSQSLTDLGAAATFYDTLVEVAKA
jgi:anaerobic selenocysteine-containing dehydrogenase